MMKTRLWNRLAFALRLRRHDAKEWLPSEFQVRRHYFFGMMSAFEHPTGQFCKIARDRGIIYRVDGNAMVSFCDASDHAKFKDISDAQKVSFHGGRFHPYDDLGWFRDWLNAANIEFVEGPVLSAIRLTSTTDVVEVQLRFNCEPHEYLDTGSRRYYRIVQE